MSDPIANQLHDMVMARLTGNAMSGGRRKRRVGRSRSRSRTRSVSFSRGRSLSGGRRRRSSSRGRGLEGGRRRRRSSSRGRGLEGGARGDATALFNKAANELVRLGRGAFDKSLAEEALLAGLDAGNALLPAGRAKDKFGQIHATVPGYFWTSPKAKKMKAEFAYTIDDIDYQTNKDAVLASALNELSFEALEKRLKKDPKLSEIMAISEQLKGRGASGGMFSGGRRASRSRSRKRLTEWQRIVKKHAGDMIAAKQEYRGKGLEGGRRSSRKKSSGKRRLGRVY